MNRSNTAQKGKATGADEKAVSSKLPSFQSSAGVQSRASHIYNFQSAANTSNASSTPRQHVPHPATPTPRTRSYAQAASQGRRTSQETRCPNAALLSMPYNAQEFPDLPRTPSRPRYPPALPVHGDAPYESYSVAAAKTRSNPQPPSALPALKAQPQQAFRFVDELDNGGRRERRQDDDSDRERKDKVGKMGGACWHCKKASKRCDGNDPCLRCARKHRRPGSDPRTHFNHDTDVPTEEFFKISSLDVCQWARRFSHDECALDTGTRLRIEITAFGDLNSSLFEFAFKQIDAHAHSTRQSVFDSGRFMPTFLDFVGVLAKIASSGEATGDPKFECSAAAKSVTEMLSVIRVFLLSPITFHLLDSPVATNFCGLVLAKMVQSFIQRKEVLEREISIRTNPEDICLRGCEVIKGSIKSYLRVLRTFGEIHCPGKLGELFAPLQAAASAALTRVSDLLRMANPTSRQRNSNRTRTSVVESFEDVIPARIALSNETTIRSVTAPSIPDSISHGDGITVTDLLTPRESYASNGHLFEDKFMTTQNTERSRQSRPLERLSMVNAAPYAPLERNPTLVHGRRTRSWVGEHDSQTVSEYTNMAGRFSELGSTVVPSFTSTTTLSQPEQDFETLINVSLGKSTPDDATTSYLQGIELQNPMKAQSASERFTEGYEPNSQLRSSMPEYIDPRRLMKDPSIYIPEFPSSPILSFQET